MQLAFQFRGCGPGKGDDLCGMRKQVCVIINPASGRGRGLRAIPAIKQAFSRIGVTEFWTTAVPGDEARYVERALREGFTTIVAAGGDGTWSNVGTAILREGAGKTVSLALIAAGTGNDLAKSIGVPAADFGATARLIADGSTTMIDAGRINDDFFLNSVGFGFDASVLAQIQRYSRLRGSAVYIIASLQQLFTYRGLQVSSPHRIPSHPMMITIANGGYLGGAFRIAPNASITDGQLDAVVIGEMGPLSRLMLFAAAVKGSHIGRAGVTTFRTQSVTLSFEFAPACQRDGELDQLAVADVTLQCEPGALRIVGFQPGVQGS